MQSSQYMVEVKSRRYRMPSRPKNFCRGLNCNSKANVGSTLCCECDKTKKKQQPTPSEQGYDYHWSKVSKLVRRNEPVCRMCKQKLATLVDHIIPLKQGGERLAIDNLQPLCLPCHNTKTRQDETTFNYSN